MHKTLYIILITFLCFSCTQTGKKHFDGLDGPGNNWLLTDSTTSRNTYTPGGLLSTSSRISYYYHKGRLIIMDSTHKVNTYDNANRLVDEKYFIFERGIQTLRSEYVRTYNKDSNLVRQAIIEKGKVYEEDINQYNSQHQRIKTISISTAPKISSLTGPANIKSTKPISSNASAKATDTTIQLFTYNKNGSLAKIINQSPNKAIKSIITRRYSGENLLLEIEDAKSKNNILSSTFFVYTDSSTIEIRDLNSTHITDTTWFDDDKPIKMISRNLQNNVQNLRLFKYDDKWNEIGSAAYKRTYSDIYTQF